MSTLTIASPSYADRLHALHAARGAEEMFASAVWTPAYDASEAGGTRISDAIDAEMTRLTEARCVAEDEWIVSPAPDIASVLCKIDYARPRWSDMVDWPDDWWAGVLADLRRLSSDPHTAWLAERDALLRRVNSPDAPADDDDEADRLIAQSMAIESRILATPATTREGVLVKALLIVCDGAMQRLEPSSSVFANAKALGLVEYDG